MARSLAGFLLLILTFILNNASSGQEGISNKCIGCHEDTYIKALSNPYQHSVVTEKCPMCHIIEISADNNIKQMRFSIIQDEHIIYLGNLPDNKKYILEATAMDSSGQKSAPVTMDILPDDAWEFRGQRSSIKKISGVEVAEVKKAAFVRAVVTWETDAYATTEIEYIASGKYPRRIRDDDIYSKKHKVTLSALKHKKNYRFRVISTDMNGIVMRSEEYGLDTSNGFSTLKTTGRGDFPLPNINFIRVFRVQGKEGFYMNVAANKPSELTISIKEKPGEKTDKHGLGLVSEKYLKIDICYKCHPHDSSHPVGVKAEGPTLRTPTDLPTIEDGIITCVTCHEPHGGKRLYYNRFDYRKDICIKCHLKGGAYI